MPLRCCSFGAADKTTRHVATGDFDGRLQLWQVCFLQDSFHYSTDVFIGIQIVSRYQCPMWMHMKQSSTWSMDQRQNWLLQVEMVSDLKDIIHGSHWLIDIHTSGCVKVWDTRQLDKAVFSVRHTEQQDAWSVAFGKGSSTAYHACKLKHIHRRNELWQSIDCSRIWEWRSGIVWFGSITLYLENQCWGRRKWIKIMMGSKLTRQCI